MTKRTITFIAATMLAATVATSAQAALCLNGIETGNGLNSMNGIETSNGLNSMNGIETGNGLHSNNGLSSSNGPDHGAHHGHIISIVLPKR